MQTSRYDRRTNDPWRIARNHVVRTMVDPFDAPPLHDASQRRFVIFGLGRNGTSLLVDLLNTDPGVRCDGELFLHWRWRPKRIIAERAARDPRTYGFKLLTYQTTLILGFRHGRGLLDWLEASGFRFIRVRRANLFRHALSQINARQSRFHVRDETDERARTHVSIDDIDAWIARIRRNLEAEERALRGRALLELIYERDLRDEADQRRTAETIGAHLGAPVTFQRSRYRKVVADDLSRNFTNADEIREHMDRLGYD